MRRPDFVPLSKEREVRIYRRNLPHWRQPGATYFVTCRLGDFVPAAVVRQWRYEQQLWLKARGIVCDTRTANWRFMMSQLSLKDRRACEKFFGRKLQRYLDQGLGACHLRDDRCVEIVRKHLEYGDGVTHHLGDFVIMPNHLHLLITPEAEYELERILQRIKGASARDCNQVLGRSGKFWQEDSYDHIVRSLRQLQAFRDYIACNPAAAGIAISPRAFYLARWMDDWFTS